MPPTAVRPYPASAAPTPDSADDANDLTEEAGLLRAAIRRLSADKLTDAEFKSSAELRRLIETLCTVLKTTRTLLGHEDPRRAQFDRVLDELGRQELERAAAEQGRSADA